MATKKVVEQKEESIESKLYAFHVKAVLAARQALKDENVTERYNRSAHGMQVGAFERNGTRWLTDGQPDCAKTYLVKNKVIEPKSIKAWAKIKDEKDGVEYLKQQGVACAIIAVAYRRSLVAVQSVPRQGKESARIRPNPFNAERRELTVSAMKAMQTTLANDKVTPLPKKMTVKK